MFSTRLIAVFALFVFGVTAAGSWYLQRNRMEKSLPGPAAPAAPADVAPGGNPFAASPSPAAEMPVAVRPKPITAEELVQLGDNLRKQEEALARRGRELDQQRSRMQLSMEDIRREQQEIESLQEHLQTMIAAAEQLLTDLAEKSEQIRQEQVKVQEQAETIQTSENEFKESETVNIKRMAAWFAEMEPETAANYLRGLCDNGNLDMAVRMLAEFEERDAAKIITEVKDENLVAQLTDKFRGLKRPEKKAPLR